MFFQRRMQELSEMTGKAWDEHYGTLCLGVNWDLFLDRDHILVGAFFILLYEHYDV
jgi:hypothetical protein